MLEIMYNKIMYKSDIKNIIYILYLIHFFDYCKLYDLSLYLTDNFKVSIINKSDNLEIINNFMESILNRYTTIRHWWFIAVYRAIIYLY
jgi:hypothetical protein